jgi:cell division septation protein DedD
MKKYLIFLALITTSFSVSFGQAISDDMVNEYLKYVAHGRVSEVKLKLPDMLAEYPNDPGVKLLHAVVIEDASKALDIYVSIIREFPQSQWADDAYWRVIQYYAIIGDIDKAQFELDNFRKRYPASSFLGAATDVVRSAERIAPLREEKIASRKPVVPDTRRDSAPLKNIYEQPVTSSDVKKTDTPVETPKPAKIKEQETPTNIPTKTYTSTGEKRFGLQVGVYRDMVRAESERDKYIEKRIRTTIIPREINGEMMHAVIVGDYTSQDRAEKAKKIVQRECECKPIVVEK